MAHERINAGTRKINGTRSSTQKGICSAAGYCDVPSEGTWASEVYGWKRKPCCLLKTTRFRFFGGYFKQRDCFFAQILFCIYTGFLKRYLSLVKRRTKTAGAKAESL